MAITDWYTSISCVGGVENSLSVESRHGGGLCGIGD